MKVIVTTLRGWFLEPISALTHLFAAVLSFAGLLLLTALTFGETGKMLSLQVYGASLVVLFSASALLHGLKLRPPARMWLNRLDHAAVFVLIAGTYTPIVFNLLPHTWRMPILAAIWLVAGAGIIYKMTSDHIHGRFNKSIYPLLSWGGAVPLVLALRLRAFVATPAWGLLLLGGLIYTVGFAVYYSRWPDLWPTVFGHHELWHLFVIGGSLCHFLFMLIVIVPLP